MSLHPSRDGLSPVSTGIVRGEPHSIGRGLNSDTIVEPTRGPLIPGFSAVKAAALEAGAFGCTISGAGPTAVAVVGGLEEGREVLKAMKDSFSKQGNLDIQYADVVKLCKTGAKCV